MVLPFNPGPSAFWSTARNEPRPAPAPVEAPPAVFAAGIRQEPRRRQQAVRRRNPSGALLTLKLSRRRAKQVEAAAVGLLFLTAVCVAGVLSFKAIRFVVLTITALSATAPTGERGTARTGIALPMTVRSGDTLWSLAGRYGSPDDYILNRVDRLARVNRLASDARLVPGQRIVVPVENPVEVARIRRLVAAADPR